MNDSKIKDRTQEEWKELFTTKNAIIRNYESEIYDLREKVKIQGIELEKLRHLDRTIEVLKDIIINIKNGKEGEKK